MSGSGTWRAEPVVDLALAMARGEPGAGRVLKQGHRGSVVWLDGVGPQGEAVVVKTALQDGPRRLAARLLGSPAERQLRAARLLVAAGVGTPAPLAAVDRAGPGAATSSFVAMAEAEAQPLDVFLPGIAGRDRRVFARDLGRFLAAVHQGGVWVPDLRDKNLLAAHVSGGGFRFSIVDLDRARPVPRGLSWRRRRRSLVQLDRTLGWIATERERIATAVAYWRAWPRPRPPLGPMVAEIDAERRRKDVQVARRRLRAGIVPEERQKLSCIVVTGNEIAHIRNCLESVAFADEIVVVDSFSTDGTHEVCREFTPRVLRRAWTGYRDQKAYALSQSTHPWILNVDADERVSPELRADVERVLTSDGRGYDGFEIPRLVHYLGRWWRYGGWYPDLRLRLFRRERATWGGTDPHEHVILRGRIGRLDSPLWHFTYDDVADHVATIDRFTTIASRSGSRPPRRASWSSLVLRPAGRFLRFYVLKGGFRMGFPGLFAGISAAVYGHLKYAKRDERARGRGDSA
ncbi:glycosyltransferase family 2 protein [bacterium]|nr:glycosyltransferase family 2 protein [bacterium]